MLQVQATVLNRKLVTRTGRMSLYWILTDDNTPSPLDLEDQGDRLPSAATNATRQESRLGSTPHFVNLHRERYLKIESRETINLTRTRTKSCQCAKRRWDQSKLEFQRRRHPLSWRARLPGCRHLSLDGIFEQLSIGLHIQRFHHAVLMKGHGARLNVEHAGHLLHRQAFQQ